MSKEGCVADISIPSRRYATCPVCSGAFTNSLTADDDGTKILATVRNDSSTPKGIAFSGCDFIKPIVDTLDLYHHQGVDPRAIAISFKELAEKHPEAELRIVGMEVKGEGGD